MQPLRWSASPASSASLVAVFVTYLQSPFPLEVASHHPPFRHDSVGREHFRPVEHTRNNLKKTSQNKCRRVVSKTPHCY